jgi:hypothetical protein
LENIINIEDNNDYSIEKETVKVSTVFDAYVETKENQKRFARSDEKRKGIDDEIKAARYVGQSIEDVTTSIVNISVPVSGGTKTGASVPNETLTKQINIVPTKKDLVRSEIRELVRKKAIEFAQKDSESD